MMHTLYAWCVLTLEEVRPTPVCFRLRLPDVLGASKAKPRGSSAVVNSYREWARDRLMLIGTKLGGRLKNSVLRMYLLLR